MITIKTVDDTSYVFGDLVPGDTVIIDKARNYPYLVVRLPDGRTGLVGLYSQTGSRLEDRYKAGYSVRTDRVFQKVDLDITVVTA